MTAQTIINTPQPALFAISAKPKEESALPIYVQAFVIPEMVEILPVFLNLLGM